MKTCSLFFPHVRYGIFFNGSTTEKREKTTRKVNALISVCDNPVHGLAVELSAKACDVVRTCVAGALTATREVVEVALEVRNFGEFEQKHGHCCKRLLVCVSVGSAVQ